jgi:hypothetical protein
VDGDRIVDLPLNGRNVVSLASLVPGVTRAETPSQISNTGQRVNVNGNRSYSTNMQLDGGDLYFSFRGGSILMPPPDAVQEMKFVTSGMTAEYGRGTAVLTAVTRSGTNALHGSLWEYLRNDDFDARRFFDNSKAKLRYNQFGGTVGGPVLKNRLFYFGSFQGLEIRRDSSATSAFPPDESERRGQFPESARVLDPLTNQPFPGGRIPDNRLDPVALKLLQKVPLPNSAGGRLSTLASQPFGGKDYLARSDWNIRDTDRLSVRYFQDVQSQDIPFPVVQTYNSNVANYSPGRAGQNAMVITANYLHTWSPVLLTNTRVSFSRFHHEEVNTVTSGSLAELGARFPVAAGPPRPAEIVVSGRFTLSPNPNNPRTGTTIDVAQDWTRQAGRHEWKWGALFMRRFYEILNDQASSGWFMFDGTFTKNAFADYLLGRSVRFMQNSLLEQGGRQYAPAFYLQDNIRASRRLTVNLGLRWEVYGPWLERSGQAAAYIPGVRSRRFPTAPVGMVYQDDPEFPYHTDGVNIAPRAGFAWDLSGDGKTSLRGGYGTMYDGVIAQFRLNGNQPFSLSLTETNPGPLADPYANTRNPFPYEVNPAKAVYRLPTTIETDLSASGLQAMYTHNVNLTVERQLFRDWMAQVGYVGNFARKLYNTFQRNPAVYRPGATTRDTESRRLLGPDYTGFISFATDGTSSYNGLQVLVQRRMSAGFTVIGHYTWAKAIDDACSVESMSGCRQQDPFDRHGSRGPGDYDQRHTVVVSYVWDVPRLGTSAAMVRQTLGGWRLAGINRIFSGRPFSVYTGVDASLTAVNADRPDVVGDWRMPSGRSKAEQLARWFNPAAFRSNAPGKYGNAGRNVLHGPGGWSWDLSLQKDFPTRERQRLEFRVDLFNILNHATFSAPAATLSAPQSLGRITGSSDGRVMQLALRYQF